MSLTSPKLNLGFESLFTKNTEDHIQVQGWDQYYNVPLYFFKEKNVLTRNAIDLLHTICINNKAIFDTCFEKVRIATNSQMRDFNSVCKQEFNPLLVRVLSNFENQEGYEDWADIIFSLGQANIKDDRFYVIYVDAKGNTFCGLTDETLTVCDPIDAKTPFALSIIKKITKIRMPFTLKPGLINKFKIK